jgi:hypothetical protein
MDLFKSEQRAMAGFCEHCNGTLVTKKKGVEFLDQLSNYQYLRTIGLLNEFN